MPFFFQQGSKVLIDYLSGILDPKQGVLLLMTLAKVANSIQTNKHLSIKFLSLLLVHLQVFHSVLFWKLYWFAKNRFLYTWNPDLFSVFIMSYIFFCFVFLWLRNQLAYMYVKTFGIFKLFFRSVICNLFYIVLKYLFYASFTPPEMTNLGY